MKTSRFALILLVAMLGPVAGQVGEEEPTIVVPPAPQPLPEEVGEEPPSFMIGMEAYREVLESGRYLVGPGDGFLIHLTGMESSYYSEVLAEGDLFVPQIGRVQVAETPLGEARQAIEEAFRRTFKEGEISIGLSQLRQFPVSIVGAVARPGLYVASGVVRVSELIRQARVVGREASRRNIRVVKTGSLASRDWDQIKELARTGDIRGLATLSHRVDLELYGVTGDSRYNPFIEDGDVVIVPPRRGSVAVQGAVQRPGVYEFVEGDRVSDLLILALGPAPDYDEDRVQLFRFTEDMIAMHTHPVNMEGVLAKDPEADFSLQMGDWLVFRAIEDFQEAKTVNIVGEVAHPGYYVVEKNATTLREVIGQAGGFTDDASLQEARVIRPPFQTELEDPEVERIRTIPVPDRDEDENQYFIMKTREIPGQMVVNFVALFEQGDESQDIVLMPGDIINVPPQQRTVVVSGQAASPGAVLYEPGYTVWDYIDRAGGFGWRASKDVRVIKARTGELKQAGKVEQVEPGDRIWVKEKPKRDYWEIFTQAMTVVGNVATVVLIFVSLTK